MMKHLLIITGLLAALATAFPGLVAVGYLLLIVPGLALTYAPTVFVYLLATAGIRKCIPVESKPVATMTALAIAGVTGWLVMQPSRTRAMAEFQSRSLPAIETDKPIRLHGHILIERQQRHAYSECDYLCLALLDCPGVESVTIATIDPSEVEEGYQECSTYQLISTTPDAPEGITPLEPGEIIRHDHSLAKQHAGRLLRPAVKAVEANWAMRLTSTERLRQMDSNSVGPADWVIRIQSQAKFPTSKFRRVAIRDATGETHFRKTYLEQAIPSQVLHFGYRLDLKAGLLAGGSFHVGRDRLTFGSVALDPESTVLSAIEMSPVRCDDLAIDDLRRMLSQSLDNPNATKPQLGLARYFLGLFHFDTTETDDLLVAKILSDERIDNIDDAIQNVYSRGKTPLELRDVLAERVAMPHSSAELRQWIGEQLAAFPRGTFAEPSPAHWEIWTNPDLYREAPAFIKSLADVRTPAAISTLNAIFEQSVSVADNRQRLWIMRAVCQAYTRLGPEASTSTDRICELFLTRPSPILSNSKDATAWRVALVRMGVPLEGLPMFPNQTGQSADRIIRRVSERVERYNRDLLERTQI